MPVDQKHIDLCGWIWLHLQIFNLCQVCLPVWRSWVGRMYRRRWLSTTPMHTRVGRCMHVQHANAVHRLSDRIQRHLRTGGGWLSVYSVQHKTAHASSKKQTQHVVGLKYGYCILSQSRCMRAPRLGGMCYWTNKSGVSVTYDQAELACSAHGGDLAHLLSADVVRNVAQRMMFNATTGVWRLFHNYLKSIYHINILQPSTNWLRVALRSIISSGGH